jgi:diguanylate cyclase (GGDEF)-like protein
MVTTDILTGLYNRYGLREYVTEWLAQNTCGYVIVADADGFKAINDRFGHDIGDQCLVAIAARMRAMTDGGDLVARIRGEQFLICLAQMHCGARAKLAEALTQNIDLPAWRVTS